MRSVQLEIQGSIIDRKPRARKGFIPLARKVVQNIRYKALRAAPQIASGDNLGTWEDPARAVETQEKLTASRECLSKLAPDEQAFLTYRHVHGLTKRAVCDLLG